MTTFILNGQQVQAPDGLSLLEYLREEANLTSVKNGCHEGACGACMVVVDGKAQRACLLNTSKIEGKTIITLEGLPQREKNIFAYTFGEAGAVQCGFCIPGMVISAKALLDKNNNPARNEIKEALKFNVCRCTGYVKIEKAITMAAEYWRDQNKIIPVANEKMSGILGQPIQRVDAAAKALGTGKYTDDLKFEGMLYGRALRAPSPRALIKNIDISEAKNHPDVVTVMLAEDVPGERFIGHLPPVQDWPALIAVGEETRYVGDAIALVAAKSKKAADEALKLIKVDYEELPPLSSPEMAMAEGAPKLHPGGNILKVEKLYRGNPDEAIKIQNMLSLILLICLLPNTRSRTGMRYRYA